jgi:clan AA aspartic protease (TIGR02281 family)
MMTLRRTATVWALAVVVALASAPGTVAAQGRPSHGAVSGLVQAQNGVPLEGADVSLEGHDRTATDSQGRFTFSRVSPGNYRLSVRKSGFPEGTRAFMVRAGANEQLVITLSGYAEPPAATAGEAKVPLIRHGNVFLLRALLNARRQAIFILDTGASLTTISTAVAQELGIPFGPGYPSRTIRTASGTVEAYIVSVESIQVGGLEARDVQVAILDLPGAGQVVGLLGNTFLSRFRVQLDAAQSLLTLSQ